MAGLPTADSAWLGVAMGKIATCCWNERMNEWLTAEAEFLSVGKSVWHLVSAVSDNTDVNS